MGFFLFLFQDLKSQKEFGIWDLGFGIWDLRFGIWDLEFSNYQKFQFSIWFQHLLLVY